MVRTTKGFRVLLRVRRLIAFPISWKIGWVYTYTWSHKRESGKTVSEWFGNTLKAKRGWCSVTVICNV